MKKIYTILAMALCSLAIQAQQTLNLSTNYGTALEKYAGKECKVNVNRYMVSGWNTLSLPFAVTEQELNEAFGADCRLERLVGAEETAEGITLFFQDCKASGMEPNMPYIIYYTGKNGSRRLSKTAIIDHREAALSFTVKGSGDVVSMVGTQRHVNEENFYGILVTDNADAKFVAVDKSKNGFFATRCYVKVQSGGKKMLSTRHLAAGEATGISQVLKNGANADVFSVSGVKVASGVSADEMGNLQPGIYVVNGRKVVVK